mmetsp:Transcript_6027/g.19946  ORF Transcript_6027/g.19946 Transcript_6027/m.19946 type:complete len:214 (+) Transcript_6027:346-987(+)
MRASSFRPVVWICLSRSPWPKRPSADETMPVDAGSGSTVATSGRTLAASSTMSPSSLRRWSTGGASVSRRRSGSTSRSASSRSTKKDAAAKRAPRASRFTRAWCRSCTRPHASGPSSKADASNARVSFRSRKLGRKSVAMASARTSAWSPAPRRADSGSAATAPRNASKRPAKVLGVGGVPNSAAAHRLSRRGEQRTGSAPLKPWRICRSSSL